MSVMTGIDFCLYENTDIELVFDKLKNSNFTFLTDYNFGSTSYCGLEDFQDYEPILTSDIGEAVQITIKKYQTFDFSRTDNTWPGISIALTGEQYWLTLDMSKKDQPIILSFDPYERKKLAGLNRYTDFSYYVDALSKELTECGLNFLSITCNDWN